MAMTMKMMGVMVLITIVSSVLFVLIIVSNGEQGSTAEGDEKDSDGEASLKEGDGKGIGGTHSNGEDGSRKVARNEDESSSTTVSSISASPFIAGSSCEPPLAKRWTKYALDINGQCVKAGCAAGSSQDENGTCRQLVEDGGESWLTCSDDSECGPGKYCGQRMRREDGNMYSACLNGSAPIADANKCWTGTSSGRCDDAFSSCWPNRLRSVNETGVFSCDSNGRNCKKAEQRSTALRVTSQEYMRANCCFGFEADDDGSYFCV